MVWASAPGSTAADATLSSPMAAPAAVNARAQAMASSGLPVVFEANEGQAPAPVRYLARTGSSTLELTNTSAVLTGEGGYLRMFLEGADPSAHPVAEAPLPGIVNYFVGNNPGDWHTGIATYQDVAYADVYPGVDLTWHGAGAAGAALEYDFSVAPGADPSAILINMAGATKLSIDGAGNLVIVTPYGTLRQAAPVLYQQAGTRQVPVSGGYVLGPGATVGFKVGTYDHTEALTIDPLLYSTYIGTTGGARAAGVAIDSSGDAYLTGFLSLSGSSGTTGTTTFPITPGAFETTPQGDLGGASVAFVSKFDPTKAGAQSLIYSSFLTGGPTATNGGPQDAATAIAVDARGDAYIVGGTTSPTFPVTAGAFKSTVSPGNGEGFVSELNPSGSALLYSTYFGGGSATGGPGGADATTSPTAIALDGQGDAYITGETTNATSFPTSTVTTPVPLQGTFLGQFNDGFVAKFDSAASGSASLVYSTYLSGSAGSDEGLGVAVDASGDAYVGGSTASTDFPGASASPIQPANGGGQDGFLTELNPSANGQLWATYLGGSGSDAVNALALDSAGNLYATGFEGSPTFTVTPGAFQSTNGGSNDAFVTKVAPGGASLVYSTLLGGSGSDLGNAIAVDSNGDAYVSGKTQSHNFPLDNPIQSMWSTGRAAVFVTKVNPAGTGLLYSTYLGGNAANVQDTSVGIGLGALGIAYVASTPGKNFNTTSNAFDATDPATASTGVAPVLSVISDPGGSTDLGVTATSMPLNVTSGNPVTYTVTVTDNPASPGPASGIGVTDTMPSGVSFGSVTATAGASCTQASGVVSCAIASLFPGDSATISILGTPGTPGTVTDTVTATENETDTNPADNTATATTTVTAPLVADVSATVSAAPAPAVEGVPLTYTIGVSNAGPSPATGTTLTDTLPAGVSFTAVAATQGSCTGGASISCALGSLASGAGATVTVGVVPTVTGTLTDSASVTSTVTDPNPANNTASVATPVNPPTADLSVTATAKPNPVYTSSTLTYSVVTTNGGPSAASGVSLTDTLAAGESFISASPSQGTCVSASSTVSCSLGSLPAGASVTTAIAVSSSATPGTAADTASVTANEFDPNTANNTATISSQVLSSQVPPSSATCGNTGVLAASGTMCTYAVTGTDVFNPPAGVTQATFTLIGGASGSTSNLAATTPGQPGGTTTGTVSFGGTPLQIDVAGSGGSVAPTSTMGGMNNGVSGGSGGTPGFGGSNGGLLTSNGDAPGGAGGNHPQNGGNGSGGGGASDVRMDPAGCVSYTCPLTDRILVAGGGGGNGGNGGNGGAQGGKGGAGGGLTGANASSTIAGGSPGAPGHGGTQSAGGIGGTNVSAGAPVSENGVTATSSAGGAGGSGPNTGGGAAGGGGGGYWGGGGGAAGGGSFGGGGGAGGG
ncbi:MAG TPA: SBBP repeat-containing protein, partial [Actinomycetota bacterium]|nr:SBBP repeat-containing protein [Actinomycetota bacterium]